MVSGLVGTMLAAMVAIAVIGGVGGIGVPHADATAACSQRPAERFEWSDGSASILVEFDLDFNTMATVQQVSDDVVAQLDSFPPKQVAEATAYLDQVAAWFGALCAVQLDYEGRDGKVPTGPTGAYGFGGINAVASEPAVIVEIIAPAAAPIAAKSTAPDTAKLTGPVAAKSAANSTEPVDSLPAEPVGGGLAKSGIESVLLTYFGTGLVAFGALALGAHRRSTQVRRSTE